MPKLTQLPDHVFNEILLEVPQIERVNLFLLNHDIFYILVPIIYSNCKVVNPFLCGINFKKYGKYINNLYIQLDKYEDLLYDREINFFNKTFNNNRQQSFDKFIDGIQTYLNPMCSLDLSLDTTFNFKYMNILNKFKINEIIYKLEKGYENLVYPNELKLVNATKISIVLNDPEVTQEMLNDLPINLKNIIINRAKLIDPIINSIIRFKDLTSLSFRIPRDVPVVALFEAYYHNLHTIVLKNDFAMEYLEAHQMDGNNFPKLKNLTLTVPFGIKFINTFQKLEKVKFRRPFQLPQIEISTTLPDSKNLKWLRLDGFLIQSELLHSPSLSVDFKLNDINFTSHNLTHLVINIDILLFESLKLISKSLKLRILVLSWKKVSYDLTNWIEKNPPKWYLSLKFIKIHSKDRYASIVEFLIASSPHLTQIYGDTWVEKCCIELNVPFKPWKNDRSFERFELQ